MTTAPDPRSDASRPSTNAPRSRPDAVRARTDASGRIILGPTVLAHWRPAASMGLPLLAVPLSTMVAAFAPGIRTLSWELSAHLPFWAAQLIEFAAAWAVTWAVTALLALAVLALTNPHARFAPASGTVSLRPGPFARGQRVPLEQILRIDADPRRQGSTDIWYRPADAAAEPARITVPFSGWDDASFDGIRALAAAASVGPVPGPRAQEMAALLRASRTRDNRAMARSLGMGWRPEWQDPSAFEAALDDARRSAGRTTGRGADRTARREPRG